MHRKWCVCMRVVCTAERELCTVESQLGHLQTRHGCVDGVVVMLLSHSAHRDRGKSGEGKCCCTAHALSRTPHTSMLINTVDTKVTTTITHHRAHPSIYPHVPPPAPPPGHLPPVLFVHTNDFSSAVAEDSRLIHPMSPLTHILKLPHCAHCIVTTCVGSAITV